MENREAMERLREAGLYVHEMDGGGCMGGSHVDASNGIRMVENAFHLRPVGETWGLHTQDGDGLLSLEDAVARIIATVKPQPSIPAPPRPQGTGTVYY